MGAQGRVWAIEPASQTAHYLAMSIQSNGFSQTALLRMALSDHVGSAWLGVQSNSELNAIVSDGKQTGTGELVRLQTLDALATEEGVNNLDFVKLDAEGEEIRIVAGGSSFFANENPLVMFELKHGSEINVGLIEAFSQAGYNIYRLMPGAQLLVPCDPASPLDPYQLNLFACKPERARQLEQEGVLVTSGDTKKAAPCPEVDLQHILGAMAWSSEFDGVSYSSPSLLALAVRSYLSAQDTTYSPESRQLALARALELAFQATSQREDVWHLATLARIAAAVGNRATAVHALGRAIDLAMQNNVPAPHEPFLPPTPEFDRIAPDGRGPIWLLSALADGFVRQRSFSTYFADRDALQNLEALRSTGFQRISMERARQLMRIRAGLQAGPTADPRLSHSSAEHRNSRFWGGA